MIRNFHNGIPFKKYEKIQISLICDKRNQKQSFICFFFFTTDLSGEKLTLENNWEKGFENKKNQGENEIRGQNLITH